MNTEIFELLRNNIPSTRLASDNKEILMRCRYCSDSANQNNAHFYISNDSLLQYHCKHCNVSGRITRNKLIEWGVYDQALSDAVGKLNREYKPDANEKNRKTEKYNFNNLKTINLNNNIKNKIDYFNNRLGLNFGLEDFEKNKIILNLSDFLNGNRIHTYTRNDIIMNGLDRNYIGFVSYDNLYVSMRDITNKQKYRYVNYKVIKNGTSNSGTLYVNPISFDLSKKVRVHISEGVMDILSIKYNVIESDDNYNDLFISVSGIGYGNAVKFVCSSLGLIMPEYHIYFDNGVGDYHYRNLEKLFNKIKPHKVIYYHNSIGKDYGVRKEEIKLDVQIFR